MDWRIALGVGIAGLALTLVVAAGQFFFPAARWLWLIVGLLGVLGLAAAGALLFAGRVTRIFVLWAPMWRFSFQASDPLPFRRLIELDRAAQRALDKLRNTRVGRIAAQLNAENPLGYYHQALTMNDAAVYGARTPSTIIDRIAPNDLRGGHICKDGKRFEEFGKVKFDRLCILRRDLHRYIRTRLREARDP